MPDFKPFKAIRPPRDRAHLVGSRSYISYSDEELSEKLAANPFTFLHVIMPEGKYQDFRSLDLKKRFEIVKKEYDQFMADGHLIRDEKDAFYLYRQTKGDQQYVGIIGGVSAQDYHDGHIKKHEQTLTKREELFKEYLACTGFNAEPVLLAYDDSEAINEMTKNMMYGRPEYEFFTTNMVKHELWIIEDEAGHELISKELAATGSFYIADGHHRCASSALLSTENPDSNSHFMAMVIPKSSLQIHEFNRLVKDLNGLGEEVFMEKIASHFEVKSQPLNYRPSAIGVFGLYMDKQWYELVPKRDLLQSGVVQELDTQILTDLLLSPILGIEDLRNDTRVDFTGGSDGCDDIKRRVDSGEFKLGLALHPVSFEQLKNVSDANMTMPPKSTWIEPKLRSGITIFSL